MKTSPQASSSFNETIHYVIADNLEEQIVWLYEKGIDIAVKIKNLLYCESQTYPKEHTRIFFVDEDNGIIKNILSSYGIGKWEKKLARLKFCRIHRSYLVNYKLIARYSRTDNQITLKISGQNIPVSKEGKKQLSAFMEI